MKPPATLSRLILAASMETIGRARHARLLHLAKNPAQAQVRALRQILNLCRNTVQGQRLGFAQIRDIDAFRAAVPIQTYEDIRPAIEGQIETGAPEIAPERPLMHARTSGTTGQPKYIPVTATTLREARAAQQAMTFPLHRSFGAFRGRVLGLGGAAEEEQLAHGAAAGATSGLIYQTMPALLRANYVVPAEVFGIEDYDLKYLLTARLALAAGDLSLIATANPSTVLRLMNVIAVHRENLVRDLQNGGFHAMTALSHEVRAAAAPLLQPARSAASRLASAGELTLAQVWPKLRAVVTWLGGSCMHAAAAVRAQLPAHAGMVDAGYVASEVRGTIVVDAQRNLALPMLTDVFFEFVENDAWDRGARDTLLLHQLEQGRDYQIIVSTAAGVLRYQMNDVMRVVGNIAATPALAFIRKGRGVTNIVGEKLSEDQIHAAVGTIFPNPPEFYVALADAEGAVYRLYVENLHAMPPHAARDVDARLTGLNIEYAAKRGSGRLAPLEIVQLRAGAGAAYHRHCVEVKGQREAQAKVLALQTVETFDFDLSQFIAAHAT